MIVLSIQTQPDHKVSKATRTSSHCAFSGKLNTQGSIATTNERSKYIDSSSLLKSHLGQILKSVSANFEQSKQMEMRF